MSENPHQAPPVGEVVVSDAPLSEAETIRSQHLKHEALLKAVGSFFLLSAVLVILMVAVLLAGYETLSPRPGAGVVNYWLTVGLFVTGGIGLFVSGWGLRKFRPWSKIPAALFAAFISIGFPLGILVGSYVLYLLFCAKGRRVLSPCLSACESQGRMVLPPTYAEIVAQTPHLRCRTPFWIWILFVVLLLLFLGPPRLG